jgi:hypothetical protein
MKILNVIHKLYNPIFGFLSVIVGLIGDLLASLLFPEFNLTYMISALGVGPGGIFFNLGLLISGLFALLFYLYLIRAIKMNDWVEHKKLLQITKFSSINSCVFFCFIGIFPAIKGNSLMTLLHGLSAGISCLIAIIYLTSFGVLFLKSINFLKFHSYLSFVTVIPFVLFLFTWTPLTEWIMTFAILIWITLIASYTVIRKM